jgi:Bacterial DNA-binding protein
MRVELRGVGVLTVKQKGDRQGRNPRTGAALIIEPHRVVRFRASELLLAQVNRPASRPPEGRHKRGQHRNSGQPNQPNQERPRAEPDWPRSWRSSLRVRRSWLRRPTG